MPRTARFDTAMLLDAAVELAAADGPAAVSMSAVARATGAPSGSVYHRFPSRPALLAALWLRTLDQFQRGFLAAVGQEPPTGAVIAAGRYVVAWSRSQPRQARVLLYGAADFGLDQWPAEARRDLEAANRRVQDALRALAGRLGWTAPPDRDRLLLLTVDLPYATVRRHLLAGEPIPAYAEDLISRCAAGLLPRSGQDG